MTGGVFPGDLPFSGGVLGPATPSRPFPVAGTQVADADDPLTMKLQVGAPASSREKTGLPPLPPNRQLRSRRAGTAQIGTAQIGTGQIGTVQLDGFVACVVLGAGIVDHRLVVRVEPCFLIHHTLWTVSPDPSGMAAAERNVYLHKLRLTR